MSAVGEGKDDSVLAAGRTTVAQSLVYKRIILLVLMAVFCASCSQAQVEVRDESVDLCQMLFDRYIAHSTKLHYDEVKAAQVIIASSGRTIGFWKPVLEKLRESNYWGDEHKCLDILGRMLEYDADARDVLKSGQIGPAAFPGAHLPPELVPELIARAQKADGNSLDGHILALARARDERCKDLFREIITGKDKREPTASGKYHVYQTGTQFHAAVGLANLGDSAGIEWLIEHSDNKTERTGYAPRPIGGYTLSSSCILALQSLVQRSDLKNKTDFEAWWKANSESAVPLRRIELETR